MQRNVTIVAVLAFTSLGFAACGGSEPPEPPPVVEEEDATPDADSLAAARAAERESAAAELCEEARRAVSSGDVDRARNLVDQINRDYADTECGAAAGEIDDRIEAVTVLRERIHFEFDRSRITDDAAAVLQRKAEILRAHPDLRVTVEGHCDERGSLEYNMALGQRRAESARRYLTGLGVSGEMFETVSFGEERPIAQGSNEQAWSENRRAEFAVDNLDAL